MKGAAGLALELLERAGDCAKRLGRRDGTDEDLHQFRVSLRRLLVHLKAHEGLCGIPKKDRKRLRRVFRSMGPQRDAQIERAWLLENTPALATRLRERRALPAVDGEALSSFSRVAKSLRAALENAGKKGFSGPRFQKKARKASRRRAEKLAERLAWLGEGRDPRALHRARVAVKRLRYLLEPVEDAESLPSLDRIKELQSALGAIHDLEVIEAGLRALAARKPALASAAFQAAGKARLEKEGRLTKARRLWAKPLL